MAFASNRLSINDFGCSSIFMFMAFSDDPLYAFVHRVGENAKKHREGENNKNWHQTLVGPGVVSTRNSHDFMGRDLIEKIPLKFSVKQGSKTSSTPFPSLLGHVNPL